MDDRASVSTYNFNPGYRASSSMLPGEYSDVMNQAASRRIPLQDAMYRTLEQQHYQGKSFGIRLIQPLWSSGQKDPRPSRVQSAQNYAITGRSSGFSFAFCISIPNDIVLKFYFQMLITLIWPILEHMVIHITLLGRQAISPHSDNIQQRNPTLSNCGTQMGCLWPESEREPGGVLPHQHCSGSLRSTVTVVAMIQVSVRSFEWF